MQREEENNEKKNEKMPKELTKATCKQQQLVQHLALAQRQRRRRSEGRNNARSSRGSRDAMRKNDEPSEREREKYAKVQCVRRGVNELCVGGEEGVGARACAGLLEIEKDPGISRSAGFRV